jgi:putative ABC transport system permease protein
MPINTLLKVAWQSLLYRRGSVLLTVAAIAVSVFTLLGTEHVRQAAKQSFNSTISGVDLIVGPRTSDVNLLLTTVFRIGSPSQNMSWGSYQKLISHKNVAWTIPISLGDSHKGFRVVGTELPFFHQFKFGQSRNLSYTQGGAFSDVYDIVLGAQVAIQLNYELNQKLILSHGLSTISFQKHDAYPFRVVGILAATGTPVDNALYVSLAGLEAIHQTPINQSGKHKQMAPTSITAAMVGLTSKLATFKVQREINTSTDEPLTAILPGVALTQLWQMSRGLENTLRLMARLILFASLLGLAAMLFATLRERRYELTVMRTLGANLATIFTLIQIETLCVALLGILLGSVFLIATIHMANPWVMAQYGIDIGLSKVTFEHITTLSYVLFGAILVGAVPAVIGSLKSRVS